MTRRIRFRSVVGKAESVIIEDTDDATGELSRRVTVQFKGEQAESITVWLAEGLRPSSLQRLPWSSVLTAADAAHRGMDGSLAQPGKNRRDLLRALSPPERPPAPGRPWSTTHDKDFYQRIADRYTALRASQSSNPTAAIAAEQNQNRNTVAGWVRKARQLGYLPPARPGKPG